MLAREDPDLKDLANRIHTLYFLATPHRGSEFSKLLANILGVSYGQKPFVSELNRDSDSITQINDSFRHFAKDVQLWSFYETELSNLVVTQAVIVDKSSATLGFPNEKCYPLNADHRGVCKFHLQTDPNYQTLRNSFSATIDKILFDSNITFPFFEEATSKLQLDQLVELTGISKPPEDELSTLEDIRIPGTCEWFIKKEVYQSWQGAQPGSWPFFWLTGNAGFGKSVISSCVINELQQKKLRVSYFFFKYGNSDKSTTVGCLQALMYQMARADNSILQRLLEVQKSSPSWEKWDEKTIWQKLFLGCIFKGIGLKTYFWVIDAVDECQKSPSFLNLLTNAPPWLRILFTSRMNLDIERCLNSIKNVEHYELQKEDTLDDFNKLIKSKMEHVPASYGRGTEKLRQRILEKASGSFLWTSLVIRRLEETYSEEEAEKVLAEVPTDMNALYSKMLQSVLQNSRAVVLAKSIYMWTSLSLRPLKIDGLQCALKMDTHQTVYNLERFISSISGQLVSVNQNHEAEVIHQTAKEYLLQQKTYSDLSLHRLQCHTRMAEICLTLLAGNFTKGQELEVLKGNLAPSMLVPASDFRDYACKYFSDHLGNGSSEDDQNWNLLCKFLDCNVLVWVEYLAEKRSLRSLTRAATNLQAYFRRRLKYLSPISPQRNNVETWIYDLFRLGAKFGVNLNISPSSIRNLVPAMCPSDSHISKFHASQSPQTGLKIKGMTDRSWDDCLARVDYPTQQTSAIGCGDQYSAVALFDGTICLYFQGSTQSKLSLTHGERAKILVFSRDDSYLASGSQRKVKVWDPGEGIQLWAFDTDHQSLTLLFVEEEGALVAATQGNYTIRWDICEGRETGQWQWTDTLHGTTNEQKSWQQPRRALFSPNHGTLAVSYRGLPLYLFDLATQKFLGCFSRETGDVLSGIASYHVVDALAFNPNPKMNILVVSYGDGELAVYDVESTQLRYRRSCVFAHCLTCSPDGRTLVTGSSRGTLQIFNFAYTGEEYLLQLYSINAYEDGIRDIAFYSNNLRFADIRRSTYRIWEPSILVCHNVDGGSQNELSHKVSVEVRSVSMLEEPPDPEITAMCCPSGGNFVFCGKRDGSVSYFETNTARQKEILYRHAKNIAITCIAFIEARSLLVTADEAGRVLISQIIVSIESCELLSIVAEIRSKDSLSALLPSLSYTKLLLRGKRSAQVWTTEGKNVGATIFFGDDEEKTFTNHPLHPDHFVSIDQGDIRIFSWTDARESAHSLYARQADERLSSSYIEQWSPPLLAFLSKRNTASTSTKYPKLRIWPASDIIASNFLPPSIPLLSFDNNTYRIRQIISVTGSVVFFLDLDLWICSLDLITALSISKGASRHFFLLSEWQSIDGGFIIEYVPATCEFVVARKHQVLVISRGLTFEEPWISKSD